MVRFLVSVAVVAVLAAGGVYAQWRLRPCEAPLVALDKVLPLEKWRIPPRPACDTAAAKAESDAPREVEPPAVTVVSAEQRRFTERLFVSGTLTAREEVMVAPKIPDLTVIEIDAEDGDHVEKGQLLARLDRSQLNALLSQNDAAITRADAAINQAKSMIAQSQSQLDFASNDYDRARKLQAGVMSLSTVEQRETSMKTAQAALAAAKDALAVSEADRKARDADRQELMVRIDRTDVRAPVAGLISRRAAKLGAVASLAGDPLFRIIEDGALDLVADVPEQWLPRLKPGMTAQLKLPGVEAPVMGAVRLVDQEVDKLARTGKARIALSDVSHARIGAFASGEVDLVTRDGVAAPTTAVKRDGDEGFALVVKDGKVESRQVKLGIVEGDTVEILSGVQPGETLVARAASFLRPGDKVRPMPQLASAGG
jgi:RND family efflux transporter MFP subunit